MKNKKNLISIVVNCYNGEKYLEQSIKSIINQTYKNWELIFWDNQSKDKSLEIFKSHEDKRLKYFLANQHTSLYQARNLAIEKSKGDYIAFLDTDDLWEKDKLELQMNLFNNPEVGVVFSNAWIIKKKIKNKKIHEKKKLPQGYIYDNLIKHYNVGIVTAVIKKEYYFKLKKKFDERFSIIGDFDLFLRLSKICKFQSIQRPLASYRLHGKNLSTLNKEKEIEELVQLKSERAETLEALENTSSISPEMDAEIVMNMKQIEDNISYITNTLVSKRSVRSSYKNSIKNFSEQVKNLNFKLESLKSRISNVSEKECPVCAQKVTNPAMTPCCKNVFCFQCMAMALSYSPNKECPLCRTKVDISQMVAIKNGIVEDNTDNEDKLPIKIDCLMNLIKSKPNGRFLVFSEYDNSFVKVANTLNESNIRWSKLCGSSGHITNVINQYTENKIKVLLLNAKHYGSGLNLQMTTDIVLYHRMSEDLEKQVVGRGQRLGRTSTLNVHYLCYELFPIEIQMDNTFHYTIS